MAAPTKATEAKASARWLGAGLGLLRVLQLLQQAIDGLDARFEIGLLFAAGIGLFGLAWEMFQRSDGDLRQRWVFVPAIAGGAAFLAVLVLVATIGLSPPDPVPLKDQIENAKAAGQAGNRKSIGTERVDFRGAGRQSYFFEFGDEEGTAGAKARSDELQIWDVRGGKLVRALTFEPSPLGDEEALFQFRDVGDIDGDGAEELVGGYGTPAIRGELLIPFVVDWDSDARRYRLVALTPEPPEFATGARGEDVDGLRSTYGKRLTLVNRPQNTPSARLAGYPAQDFMVSPSHQVLVNAYTTDIRLNRGRRVMELQPRLFRRTGGPPALTPCMLARTEKLTPSLPFAGEQRLEGALQDFWRGASRGRNCVITG
jgi:hypothetical protein